MVENVSFSSATNEQCVCVCAHVCACVGCEPGRVHTCVHVWDAASLPLQVLSFLQGGHPGSHSMSARCALGFTVVSGPLACVLCHRWAMAQEVGNCSG